MEHTATPTRFYKSQLTWDATRIGWQIALRDGTIYRFAASIPPYLTEIQDRLGNRLTIARTSATGPPGVRISRITTPNGRWVDFNYSTGDKVDQVKIMRGGR